MLKPAMRDTASELCPEHYRDYLLALARFQVAARLGAKLDASDIVHDALLRAHQARADFAGTTPAEMKAWLRTILARTLANAARLFQRDKRDIARECSLEAELAESSCRLDAFLAADQTSPSSRASQEELLGRLAAALDELPPHQRSVVVLKHTQRLPVAEIAARLGLSVAAVAGLLRRGLQRLRERLGEEER